ncbi:hypothetical protein ACPXBB_26395, partial [Escherichia coli]|uniref:hypothetical protein n=1 Tax=Escherichia coli TaxID=562 RepID=UPI003CF5AEA9
LKVVHKHPQQKKDAEPEEDEVVSMGVPQGPPPPKETVILHDVMFAFDSARDVLPGTKNSLKKLAAYLTQAPRYKSL